MGKRIVASMILISWISSLIISAQATDQKTNDKGIIESKQIMGVTYEKISIELIRECAREVDYGINQKDYELMCRTVYCEAGNQSIYTQIMVALTILNRFRDKRFPNTIKGVIYQKNAYEVTTWKNFKNYKWTKQVEKAVDSALKMNNHPIDMFYFRTKHFHNFGKPYIRSGDLWFSTEK
jgi:spore germination cell wall hydrolase CwlJ-like protein